ncbi:MAG: hypothetical protein K8L99_33770 [Anaerolineae bacterium]|nr:hypothetical protein [Anaerolineae bacterium]GIL13726.1 MAG: hypothetical protein BroJett038_24460 [Chloroflexota bacterium]
MNHSALTGIPHFEVDDDTLFPAPVAYSTWDGCVAVWNRCVDLAHERGQYLLSILKRTAETGNLSPRDAGFLEISLDALAGKLSLAHEIQNRAFDKACRLHYGFGVGDIIEIASEDGTRLAEIRSGGLPRTGHEPNVRFAVNMVEPFQDGWLSVSVGLPLLNGAPETIAQNIRVRSDIKVTRPTDSPVHWLPVELCGEDFLRTLRSGINPNGLNIDRKSVLLAFWEETLWRQRRRPWPFSDGDIIAIKKPSQPVFHVVFHAGSSYDEQNISCTDPRGSKTRGAARMFGTLTHVSLPRGTKVSCALPAASYYGGAEYIPLELSMALALRETARRTLGNS